MKKYPFDLDETIEMTEKILSILTKIYCLEYDRKILMLALIKLNMWCLIKSGQRETFKHLNKLDGTLKTLNISDKNKKIDDIDFVIKVIIFNSMI
jgi:hypothetical protein